MAYDRWTQVDPLNQFQDPREGNRYGYVGGDPVNQSDPRGLYGGQTLYSPVPKPGKNCIKVLRRIYWRCGGEFLIRRGRPPYY